MQHDRAVIHPGGLLTRRFRIERVVGSGSMSIVVAATHLQLGRIVAIKLIRPEALAHPEIVARFLREARTCARLRSEHVVRVIDVGKSDAGWPFIVMEYLHGQSLASLLGMRGRLPFGEAIDYVLQACDAVAEAHTLGIVHRDLKPENLFLGHTGNGETRIKVLDFGISKIMAPGWGLTRTGVLMGSPAFMSPEQIRSARNVDGRSDIWSLGVILWQLLTGTLPFRGQTLAELCLRISTDPLQPLSPAVGVPLEFESVLSRALEKDRARRLATVGELVSALLPFRSAPWDGTRHGTPYHVHTPPEAPLSGPREQRSLCTTVRHAHGQGQTQSEAPWRRFARWIRGWV